MKEALIDRLFAVYLTAGFVLVMIVCSAAGLQGLLICQPKGRLLMGVGKNDGMIALSL